MSAADCNWGIGCVCIKNCNVVAVLWFVLCVWCTFYLAVLFADYMFNGLVCGAAADANALSIELLKSIGVGADWNHRCTKCCGMMLYLLIMSVDLLLFCAVFIQCIIMCCVCARLTGAYVCLVHKQNGAESVFMSQRYVYCVLNRWWYSRLLFCRL